jgi:hypothetical protein
MQRELFSTSMAESAQKQTQQATTHAAKGKGQQRRADLYYPDASQLCFALHAMP